MRTLHGGTFFMHCVVQIRQILRKSFDFDCRMQCVNSSLTSHAHHFTTESNTSRPKPPWSLINMRTIHFFSSSRLWIYELQSKIFIVCSISCLMSDLREKSIAQRVHDYGADKLESNTNDVWKSFGDFWRTQIRRTSAVSSIHSNGAVCFRKASEKISSRKNVVASAWKW